MGSVLNWNETQGAGFGPTNCSLIATASASALSRWVALTPGGEAVEAGFYLSPSVIGYAL